MNELEVRREFKNYNKYKYEITQLELDINELTLEYLDETEANLGGGGFGDADSIKAKYKVSDSLTPQVIKNGPITERYNFSINKKRNLIRMYELKIKRVENMLGLIRDEENREIVKKKYFEGVPASKLADKYNKNENAIYKNIKTAFKDIEIQLLHKSYTNRTL